jgi:hypothetical protein
MPTSSRPGGGRTGLLVAAVGLVAVVALAVGGFVLMRSGVFGGAEPQRLAAADGGTRSSAAVDPTSPTANAPGAAAEGPDSGTTPAAGSGAAVLEAGGTTLPTEATVAGATVGAGVAGADRRPMEAAPTSSVGAGSGATSPATTSATRQTSAAPQPATVSSSQPKSVPRHETAPRAAAPPTVEATATVVLPVGDPMLTEAAASYLEQGLAGNGVELLDRSAVGGAADVAAAVQSLQGEARWLVLVEGTYLDSRDVQYMGRYDRVHQGRLSVRLVDVAGGRPEAPLYNDTVEYTALSVDDVVGKALRTARRELAAKVGS